MEKKKADRNYRVSKNMELKIRKYWRGSRKDIKVKKSKKNEGRDEKGKTKRRRQILRKKEMKRKALNEERIEAIKKSKK